MKSTIAKQFLFGVVTALALSAYKPKTPAPPPPPPAPVVIVIPPRPVPPLGAPPTLVVPPFAINGKRVTLNDGLNPDQIVWNFRSALNVAALNCTQPQHSEIVVNYRNLLRADAARLAVANRGVDTGFRARYGAGFVRQREAYLTRVYNFYAFPPALMQFCDAALGVSRASLTVPPAQLHNFAAASMPQIDKVYEDFYADYDRYKTDLAAWNARYLPQAPAPTTAAVVH